VTLQELTKSLFLRNRTPLSGNLEIVMDPRFTAAHLVKVCNIKLNWTDNLADHLRFDKKYRVLTMYKHKICLVNHYESEGIAIIPQDILLEALDTLNLLFPFSDESTRELLLKEKQPFWSLGNCKRERELDLSKYSYWGDQLTELHRVFHEPPHNWWQLLIDRRDKKEYVTLMIAILAFILALFSLILGAISAVYAVKQYNLGIAQACSTWQGETMLAQYCM
jgi:hypothetical protein